MDITAELIENCSTIIGQFDSESVHFLVHSFRHQNGCSKLINLSNNLKEKFENLLTNKTDDDDTPLIRIELAIMVHFKETYLSESFVNNDNNQLRLNKKFSIDDESNLAYCFLLAAVDDRLSSDHIDTLAFLLKIKPKVTSLFDIYEGKGEKFPKFFSLLIQCGYFAQYFIIVDKLIRDFQEFIKSYEDFLITFEKQYKSLPDNGNSYTQTDNIVNQTKAQEVLAIQIKPAVSQPSSATASPSVNQPPIPSSVSNTPRKGLCVIINITSFMSSPTLHTPKRAGSDKDVKLIALIFKKLRFTVLECKYDFKKMDVDKALNHIDDKNQFGDFDCLVMFIMSHGLLHSFFTADSQEIIIRDIVRRYADSSPTTIWVGKPRLFFIQACRSVWPKHIQSNNREEIKPSDLSARMLVAYSCSPNETSKRSPTLGSIFIQILCSMLLQYSPYYSIQMILDWTAKFVAKRDEFTNQCSKTQIHIQQPEYIAPNFNQDFRFSNYCLRDEYRSWTKDEYIISSIPLTIWGEIYDLVYNKVIVRQ